MHLVYVLKSDTSGKYILDRKLEWARSSMVEQKPFKLWVERSNRSGLTKKEIELEVGAALAAPLP